MLDGLRCVKYVALRCKLVGCHASQPSMGDVVRPGAPVRQAQSKRYSCALNVLEYGAGSVLANAAKRRRVRAGFDCAQQRRMHSLVAHARIANIYCIV